MNTSQELTAPDAAALTEIMLLMSQRMNQLADEMRRLHERQEGILRQAARREPDRATG
jgi:hypothetical protein